jgi:PAS domain-containing protein
MKSANKTKKQLIDELTALRTRISELEREINTGQILRDSGETMDRSSQEMSHMHEVIFVIFDRKFEFVNDRFTELFGVMPDEACSSSFDPLSLIAPESRCYIRRLYQDACRGVFTTKQFNYTGLSKDGRKISCEAFILLIPYKWGVAIQGTLRGLSVSMREDEMLQTCHRDSSSVLLHGSPVHPCGMGVHLPGAALTGGEGKGRAIAGHLTAQSGQRP